MSSTTIIDETVLDGALLSKMAKGGALSLRSNAELVNKLNVFPVPDGDTGDNMSMTIESGVAALENTDSTSLSEVTKKLSNGMLLGARGNSGVILSQFFAGVAEGLENHENADAHIFGEALECGVKKAYKSVVTPTEGTILTVAREAVSYAVKNLSDTSSIKTLFSDLMVEMNASLERTPELLSVLKEAGVIDSGGAGLYYIMDGFNRVLNGDEIEASDITASKTAIAQINIDAFTADDEMTYGYCTEFLLRLQNAKVDVDSFDINTIIDYLQTIGNSIVAFKNDSIVKVHVHTLEPDKVLGFCRQFGEFLTLKIENMTVQHSESSEIEKELSKPAKDEEKKRYGMVAVCNGDGIKNVFSELGVDYIVDGGQTQNPSTSDFLSAFEQVNAEHIFVFPNNSNIIMAAKQAAQIYTDAQVHVIESKDIGVGYAAITYMDQTIDDIDFLIGQFNDAMATVKTGYVSPSIRDAQMNGVDIKKDDFIGIVSKEIVTSTPSLKDSSVNLLDKMIANTDAFMLTVFTGKDADENTTSELTSYLEEKYPDIELYFMPGGQDIYPYIFILG